VVTVLPGNVMYFGMTPDRAEEFVTRHLIQGELLEDLLPESSGGGKAGRREDAAFFNGQRRVVLEHCGSIDPLDIEEYIAVDGYSALADLIQSADSQRVFEELKRSGLRGRGGAGFPTWKKWEFTRSAPGERKVVLCNADEGDPGAFMDRSVLEGDPHRLIEGMAIAAYCVGADRGLCLCAGGVSLAVSRLEHAIQSAGSYGFLGDRVLGSDWSFHLEIRMGSGAFVCGEETALIASIEGHRGEPRPRPPFPAVKGLWDMPSLLNNVETYANIPPLLAMGGDEFAGIGEDGSGGTKVFALAGGVRRTGLVEVPIGTPLGHLIYEIGGGVPAGRRFKAAQIGGPSGGCVPASGLNVPLNYESLKEWGAIIGSGGLIVMDDDSCMVDVARFFLEFVQEESCGKCSPCRIGTRRMESFWIGYAPDGAPRPISPRSWNSVHLSRTVLFAAWVRRRRIRLFPPSVISGMNMNAISGISAAMREFVPSWSGPPARAHAPRRWTFPASWRLPARAGMPRPSGSTASGIPLPRCAHGYAFTTARIIAAATAR
jgi:NADH-quinone oxidoreductase subunit F